MADQRPELEELFRDAVASLDPARLVARALRVTPGEHAVGFALGVSALAMARGAGPIARGVVVTTFDDRRGVPDGWELVIGGGGDRGAAAGIAIVDLIASARRGDGVLALCSGGATGAHHPLLAPGGIEHACEGRIRGLVMSDGETQPLVTGEQIASPTSFAWAVDDAIESREFGGQHVPTTLEEPLRGEPAIAAAAIAASLSWTRTVTAGVIAGGKGRCRRLAVELARCIHGRPDRSAIVLATSGDDGDGFAGAFVDSTKLGATTITTGRTGLALGDVVIAW
ncbi:MAG TPA: DUF4147 domain-containing protein [Kofleriaceae bacterium]